MGEKKYIIRVLADEGEEMLPSIIYNIEGLEWGWVKRIGTRWAHYFEVYRNDKLEKIVKALRELGFPPTVIELEVE